MRVPKYSLHRSTGQSYVRIKGRCHYLGVHNSAKSKERYRRLIAEYIETGIPPVTRDDDKPLEVRELILKFSNHAKKYYGTGPSSQWLRMKPALRALRQLYGTLPVNEFGPHLLRLTRTSMAKESNRSRKYVNRLVGFIKHVFSWGVGECLVLSSVSDSLKKVSPLKEGRCNLKETEDIKPVADEIVDATVPHLSTVLSAMIRFQQKTGARPGEVCSMTPAMVDRSGDVWEINLAKHKTAWRGKKRVIFVGPEAQKILSPYLLRSENEHCFKPIESMRKARPRKIATNQGNRQGYAGNRKPKTSRTVRECYTTGAYGNAIRRVCRKHSIEERSPNQLRHSHATSVRKSDGLEVASILLGHSELDMNTIYAEADRAKAIEVVRRIG